MKEGKQNLILEKSLESFLATLTLPPDKCGYWVRQQCLMDLTRTSIYLNDIDNTKL